MNDHHWILKLRQMDRRVLLCGVLLSAGLHYAALHGLSWSLGLPEGELVQNRQFIQLSRYKQKPAPRELFRQKLLQRERLVSASAASSIPAPVALLPKATLEFSPQSLRLEPVQPIVRVALAAPVHPSRLPATQVAFAGGSPGAGHQVFGDCLEENCPEVGKGGKGWSLTVGTGSGCAVVEGSQSKGWVNSQLP